MYKQELLKSNLFSFFLELSSINVEDVGILKASYMHSVLQKKMAITNHAITENYCAKLREILHDNSIVVY